MKYLKLFEGKYNVSDKLNKLSAEYKQNEGKFMVFEYGDRNMLCLGKLIKVVLNGYFLNMEYYEWDDYYKGYETSKFDAQHITDVKVVKFYDTMKEAKEGYFDFIEIKKYNL
jgi:hypothetical protein